MLADGRVQEAIVELRSAAQTYPDRGDLRQQLADAYLRGSDTLSARRETVRAADLLPKDVSAQVKAGRMLLDAGQFDEAKTRAVAAMAIDARSAEALVLLGDTFARVGEFDQAMSRYREAVAI